MIIFMLDKLTYPKYKSHLICTDKKNPSKEDMPYLLEHVFDLEKKDYVTNHNQCCYYNPVMTDFYIVESENNSIVKVDGRDLVAVNNGKTSILVTDTLTEYCFKINVIVYNKTFNKSLMKKNLVLKKGTVIDLDYVLKHVHCTHYDDCIFQQERLDIKGTDLDYMIKTVKDKINDFNNILDAYRNGEIIYHPNLEDYYNISITKDNDSYKTNVSVKPNFTSHIKSEIRRLGLELRDYNRMRR